MQGLDLQQTSHTYTSTCPASSTWWASLWQMNRTLHESQWVVIVLTNHQFLCSDLGFAFFGFVFNNKTRVVCVRGEGVCLEKPRGLHKKDSEQGRLCDITTSLDLKKMSVKLLNTAGIWEVDLCTFRCYDMAWPPE